MTQAPDTHAPLTPRKQLALAVLVFLAVKIGLTVFIWLTGQHYDCHGRRCSPFTVSSNFVVNGLFQWDARHYLHLIERGYYTTDDDTTAPFFPGFPLVASLFGKVFGSALVGGIVVNHLASIAGAYCIAELVKTLYVERSLPSGVRAELPREALIFWLASPLAFFHGVFLTEALFAFASVALLLSVARGRWFSALAAGLLVTATRNAGVVVVAAAMLLAWDRRREVHVGTRGWLCLSAANAGLVALVIWQHHELGDALAWSHTQIRWNRFLTTPWRTFVDDWQGLPPMRGARNVDKMYRTQEVLALGLALPLLFVHRRLGIPRALLLLGACEWLLPLLSHSLISAARYQAGNIYFALAIPALLLRFPVMRTLVWMFFGMVTAWYASTYPFGTWAS